MGHDEGQAALMQQLEEQGVKHVKIGGFDVDGVLRGKYVSMEKLRAALAGGFGFCDVIFGWDIADALYATSSVTGWERGFPDALAVLDRSTLRPIPWEPGVSAMLADFRDEHGGPHPACPRSLLKTMKERAENRGFQARFSCEFEFFLFRESPQSLREKGFRALEPLSPGMFGYSWVRSGQQRKLMASILKDMAAFGIDVEGLHTETGPGVYEVAIRYDDVLRAADSAALFKVGMKQIAAEHGLSVTFMAKFSAALPGSGGHIHQSLWRDGKNVFASSEPGTLAPELRHYVGGLVALMPELTAMISPFVNSYKRYVPGVWAPLTASWGVENRTASLRLIGLGSPTAARVEFRQSAADLNPYIAMAATLAAGLYGIEHEIEPGPMTSGDASNRGEPLPRTLAEATERFHASARVREIFGAPFVDHYAHTRRWEV
ncbi:MAG: glutamine synthetase, partial [Myxococcales bacterium]|nr:glutamine synthetase [Myxococcales bacterium]